MIIYSLITNSIHLNLFFEYFISLLHIRVHLNAKTFVNFFLKGQGGGFVKICLNLINIGTDIPDFL